MSREGGIMFISIWIWIWYDDWVSISKAGNLLFKDSSPWASTVSLIFSKQMNDEVSKYVCTIKYECHNFFSSISNKVSLFCTLYNKKFTLVITILILMSKYTNLLCEVVWLYQFGSLHYQ
jgi:hypothetical protein